MKVVFDTNVYISGFLFPGGIPSRLLDLARDHRFELFFSPEILEEVKRVVRTKFELTLHESEKLLRWMNEAGTIVYPEKRLNLVKQCDADNRILECAVQAHPHFLVTGDKKHLVPLKHSFSFKITTPHVFYKVFHSK